MQSSAVEQCLPPSDTRKNNIQIIKASRNRYTSEVITAEHIARNTANRIVTSFIPDANIIVRIQDACDPSYPATDKTLEHFGLLEYVQLLRQCIRNNWAFSVSPIFAFNELPGEKSALALQRYYAFGQRFGIDWKDDPSASEYPNFGRKGPASIWSLTVEQRSFIGTNYAHQLLMLATSKSGVDRSPIENFQAYLADILKHVQIMSTRVSGSCNVRFCRPVTMQWQASSNM